MTMKRINKALSLILCMVLIVVMALFTIGCNDNKKEETTIVAETTQITDEKNVVGEGDTSFQFTVVDREGKETNFEVKTNRSTVGEALLDADLIEGEDSEYGLFVKKVNGIEADYDKDGTYWAFYVNDEYAMAGVDTTEIKKGESYSFRVEKK